MGTKAQKFPSILDCVIGTITLFLSLVMVIYLWWKNAWGPIFSPFPMLTLGVIFLGCFWGFWKLIGGIFFFLKGGTISYWKLFPFCRIWICLLFSLGYLEGISWYCNSQSTKANYHGTFTKGFWRNDPDLGKSPPPNVKVDCQKTARNGEKIFDVVYTTDAFSRRKTPDPHPEQKKEFFALFFGCSFVFGDGLNDNQTLPYFVSKELAKVRCYNYGFSGWGTQQMLEIVKKPGFQKEIAETKGLGIYVFIDPHIDRVIGSSFIVSNWGMGYPYYCLENSHLTRIDNFGTGRPELSQWYYQLNSINMVRLFSLDFPLWFTSDDYLLTSKIIEESERQFIQHFPEGKFLVLFYPGNRRGSKLLPYLKDLKIPVLDFSGLLFFQSTEYIIHPEDGHPNSKANHELAKTLVQELKKDDFVP